MGAADKTLSVDIAEPVNHDGADLQVGATVKLPAAAAEALLASGAALPAGTLAARAKEAAPEAPAAG